MIDLLQIIKINDHWRKLYYSSYTIILFQKKLYYYYYYYWIVCSKPVLLPVWLIGQIYTMVMIWASSTKWKDTCKTVSTPPLKSVFCLRWEKELHWIRICVHQGESMHAYIMGYALNYFGGILHVNGVKKISFLNLAGFWW
jgi:hypothetical protein